MSMRDDLENLRDRLRDQGNDITKGHPADRDWATDIAAKLTAILSKPEEPRGDGLREQVAHLIFEMDTGNGGFKWEGENDYQKKGWMECADRILALTSPARTEGEAT